MKIWVDDVRPIPNEEGWVWCKSVNQAIYQILDAEYMYGVSHYKDFWLIELIDIDHDAGDFRYNGGDYIKLLDWLEENGMNYPIHIHSMNPVGVQNMRRIIQRNGWKEVV